MSSTWGTVISIGSGVIIAVLLLLVGWSKDKQKRMERCIHCHGVYPSDDIGVCEGHWINSDGTAAGWRNGERVPYTRY